MSKDNKWWSWNLSQWHFKAYAGYLYTRADQAKNTCKFIEKKFNGIVAGSVPSPSENPEVINL